MTATLARRIEDMLAATFDYRASVVLRTRTQLRSIVDRAPDGFGAQPQRYRYDVLFLKTPLSAPVASKSVPARAGVDQVYAGPSVLYDSRLISRASQSEPTQPNRLHAHLPEHDHPQLEHHDQAPADVGWSMNGPVNGPPGLFRGTSAGEAA